MKSIVSLIVNLMVAFVMLVCGSLMTGCSTDSKADSPPVQDPVPAEAQFYSLHSGAPLVAPSKPQKLVKVLENQQDYATTLAEYSTDAPKPVDFTNGRVLLVARGWAPSPGHSIGVVSVDVAATHVVANIELTNPTCAQPQVISYPYQFVYIPTTKTILFSEKMVTYNCP